MPLVSARVVSLISPDAISASAYAGDDQSILCETLVQLQGEILGDDLANHTFEWEQSSGPVIVLINPNTLTPSFLDSGAADIEITLYVDRGTPYESSSTVLISSTPATTQRGTAMTSYAQQNSPTTTGSFSAFKSSGMGLPDSIDIDFSVGAYSYNYPPDSTYSPIYKAEDLVRIKEKLDGNYWLMNDIDLSDYDNWNPIGTATRPFSGELQGNGFSIDGLTITDTSTTTPATAVQPNLPDITTLSLTDSLVNSGDITSFPNSICWTEDGLNCAIPHDTRDIEWYSASTAFDFNTLSFVSTITADIAFTSRVNQVYFKPDGTEAYLNDYTFGRVYKFNLSTPYDLTEIDGVGPSQLLDPGPISLTLGLWLSLDGSYLYIVGERSSVLGITNYTLSTPWDLSTAVESSTVANSTFGFGRADGIIVNGAGTRMWVVYPTATPGVNTDKLRQIDMSTPHDLTTAAYSGAFFQANDPGLIWQTGITWSPGSPDDIWLAYTSTPRTLRKVSGDLSSGATLVEYGNAGLFAHIGNGAVIEQVGVTNASISGADSSVYKGILAGSAQGPTTDDGGAVTVRNSYVEGTIDSDGDLAGGLIGHTGANAGSTFENTYADVTVTGGGTDEGGWTGTFSGVPTYIENYSNISKTAAVVGTGAPGATEVSGLVGAPYTGWDFVNIWDADSISGDPFYDGVSIFADFNGADEATAYTDETGNAWSFAGTGKLDNEYVKYGTTSITRGSDTTSSHVDYAYTTAIPTLGSNDFTIEVWGFWEGSLIGGNTFVTNNIPATTTPSWRFGVSTNILVFQYNKTGDDNTEDTFKVFGNVGSPGSWKHLAIQRNGTELRCFVNGVQNGATATVGTDTIYKGTDHIALMREGNFGSASESVWMDDLRITVGSARYSTGGFTPPTTANEFTPPSFATLQNNIFDRVADEGAWLTTGFPQAALWNPPEVSTGGNTQIENKRYLGLIIEDQNPATGGWENRRFIPFEQQSALLTPGRRHRAFTVLNVEPKTKSYDRTREVTYKLPNTIVPKTETDNAVFAGGTTPLASVAYPGATSVSRDIIITKTNPRKISKSVDEDAYYVQNSKDAVSKVLALDKYVGAAKSLDTVLTTEASGTLGIGSATIAIDISITRAYGGSIGG